jgi:hypothetical protein
MIFPILPLDICPRVVYPEATDGSYPIHSRPSKTLWNIRSICRKTLDLNLVVGNSEKLERNCWFGLVEWFNMYSGALLLYQKGLWCAQFWSFLVTWCIWLFWGQLHPLKGKIKNRILVFFIGSWLFHARMMKNTLLNCVSQFIAFYLPWNCQLKLIFQF